MASSKQDEKRYHQYSLSFYQKERELNNVTSRVNLGFSHIEKNEKVLKGHSIDLFLRFSQGHKNEQRSLLHQDPDGYMEAFFDVIKVLASDRALMEYVLPTVDAILTEEQKVLREVVKGICQGRYQGVTSMLRSFLAIEDHQEVTYLAAARIASIILGELPRELFANEQKNFLLDLLQIRKNMSRAKISDYGLITCFVHLNKHSELAEIFLENGGSGLLIDCLNRPGNDIQLIYYALLNAWMLSFLESGIEKFFSSPRIGVVRIICEVLQKVSREKITRVAFIIFKGIQHSNACLQLMLDNKLLKIIDTILKGNIKDPELLESIKEIGSMLESNIRVLSSFDKYARQVNSECLEWSSVHTERFWKENAIKCENNEYQMIKKLKFILNSKRPLNLAIACYDIGEFCRFYPRGKAVIETNAIKDRIMELARYSEDKGVREQALLALQKIMIQNWQAI